MTPHNGWHRLVGALAAGAIAGTLFAGIGAPTAIAAPGDDETTDTEAPAEPAMTGDQALAIIQQDYDLGAGGGQLSNFVHEVLVLRNLGFRPSKANQKAIAEPWRSGRTRHRCSRPSRRPSPTSARSRRRQAAQHGAGRQPRLRHRRRARAVQPTGRDHRRPRLICAARA